MRSQLLERYFTILRLNKTFISYLKESLNLIQQIFFMISLTFIKQYNAAVETS